MNTYLVPIADEDSAWIEKFSAKSLSDCKDKIVERYINELNWDTCPEEWEDFVKYAWDRYYIFGTPQDIETF